MRTRRLLFLNRSYWPDAEATGQLLTELSEDLAAPDGDGDVPFAVGVVCGRPNWNPSGETSKRWGTQVRRGVTVHRVWHTRWDKGSLRARAVNFGTFVAAALLRGLFCRRADVVVVETDPFLLALAGVLLKFRHRAKLVVYAQDVHPELGVALGRVPDRRSVRLLGRTLHAAYRRADRVVVLSRDMRETFRRFGVPADRISVVPNWTDTHAVRPVKRDNPFRRTHGLCGRFVVMHSGNMGQTQRLETVIDAAARLRDRDDVEFLFVGGGSAMGELQRRARSRGVTNTRFLPYEPREKLAESLSAADLHLVSIDPRVVPFMMPSKLYGILASGTAVLAVAPDGCELTETVRSHRVGWSVAPGDPAALADRIAELADDRARVVEAGKRARDLSGRYSREVVTAEFGRLLAGLVADGAGPPRAVELEPPPEPPDDGGVRPSGRVSPG